MISRAMDAWSGWPVWAKWASGIGAVVIIEAVMVASGERSFPAGLVQHAAAVVLRYGVLALSVSAGIWIGIQIAKRAPQWAGWVGGLLVFFVVGFIGFQVTTSIPGVGWRITAMINSDCYTDWDGRSNPRICD